ncbi:tripartite tricarboxylate transporter TctB family protein [Bosea caraganae]|uniref:Tripartite tricarboxylate transporter TctB family protein n=1 Tax=Bosea caraganae TaxID=2763117 RepID=A0A370LE17_9HYPH|nr:tripartite tricarboxylate transporter TctB family protein [Bosea caraganae]RDJ27802.1 tripartite tricarboxylate transporter TctB family protein [Bosea caraganae]RDJ29815.1 tripartite tricarboxylate transporter TctB family protein [Bosea caraganae]
MLKVRSPNDVIGGLFLIAVAILALWLCASLRQGTTLEMGPGYVPRLLCAVQLVFGAIMLVQGVTTEGPPLERWVPRPILFVLASVTFFAATLEPLGLPVAVAGVVLISAAANRDTKPLQVAGMAAILAVFSVGVFVKGLGLAMPVWPSFWSL